jgi:prevent-host-death family protein
MTIVTIDAAQTTLAELLTRVEAGDEVILTRGAETIARLTPVEPAKPRPKRVPGAWKGLIHIGPEFFEPLPEEELRLWEGGDD